MAGINHWFKGKICSKGSAVRNFNFSLGYTIFMLISINRSKSFKKKSRPNFPFYSFIFLTLIILKPAFKQTNCDSQSQLKKCFTKAFLLVEVLDCLHDSYHHYQDCFIAIPVLKNKNYSTFYQMLLLLSGDLSLNPGTTPNSIFQFF